MKYNVLHNFISPVTGRILADLDYVLVGDRKGIAFPSPILIDIRLALINLRRDFNNLIDASFILGFPNEEIPNSQVLSSLADGFMFNTEGIISTTPGIPIGSLPDLTDTYLWTGDNTNRPIEVQTIIINNLPNLTLKKIWRGNASNRPIEVDDLTTVESSLSSALSDIASIFSTISSILSALSALESLVTGLEEGLAAIGGWAAIALLQTQMIAVFVTLGIHGTRLDGLDDDVVAINLRIDNLRLNNISADADVSFYNFKLINLADPINPTDGVNLRTLESYIDNVPLSVVLEGDVTGIGNTGTPIETTLELTLDEIKIAQNTVNLNNQKISDLKADEVEQLDALNAKFLWDLMHDEVGVVWL